MASMRMTAAALLAWTEYQGRGRDQGQAWFQCRPREGAASLVRFLVHPDLGMRAAGAQSSSPPLLLCTATRMVSQCLRVPDVKARHFVGLEIVGEDGQIYDVGAWLMGVRNASNFGPRNLENTNAADDVQRTIIRI